MFLNSWINGHIWYDMLDNKEDIRVICWLSLAAAVTGSRLLEVGAREPQHSRHAFDPPQASGVVPQVLKFLGGVRFTAWGLRRPFLGKCRWGSRYFWSRQACLGYDPEPRTTFKKPCAIHTQFVGYTTNTIREIFSRVSFHQGPISALIYPRLTLNLTKGK